MNNEFRIKNMIANDILYQAEQQTKENLKIYYANISQENKELKEDKKKAIEYIKKHKRKDGFLNLNEWQTRDLLEILGDKE